MPILTFVEDGDLVGYLPSCGAVARVPLVDIMREARAQLTPAERAQLESMSGDTVGGVVDDVVGGKIARKLKKGIKKIAKSKIVKAITKVVKKAVPPPFSYGVKAAAGAVKLAKAIKGKKKSAKAKAQKKAAQKIVPAVRAAAAGRISSKQLAVKARKAGVSPKVANDAATFKRMTMDAQTNPQAAAAVRLSADLNSTQPLQQARAVEALEENTYAEPSTSRDDTPASYEEAALESDFNPEEQAPQTEDSYGPEAVESFEVDDGTPPPYDSGAEGGEYSMDVEDVAGDVNGFGWN